MITLDPEGGFNVMSSTTKGLEYNVRFDKHIQQLTCECKHYSLFQTPCKHIKIISRLKDLGE